MKELLALRRPAGLLSLTGDELRLVQQHGKTAVDPDDGRAVARIVNEPRGAPMNDLHETARLCRRVAQIGQYSESNRARGLQAELVRVPRDSMGSADAMRPACRR